MRAALPQHMAVRLCLTVSGDSKNLEATPPITVEGKRSVPERHSLTAMCRSKAASSFSSQSSIAG